MSLSVEGRHCGTVYVLRCSGRVVAGEESVALEASINRGLRESRRLVIDLGGVIRIDSTSIGLLVRYLSHTRSRGGDLRLSAAPPAVADLLRATKLTTVFKVYNSEEEAITSLLQEPAIPGSEGMPAGPPVLFVDRSPDLCAFARALLSKHGYSVLTTCKAHDASLLMMATQFDYLVLGPDPSPAASAAAVDDLKGLAQSAAVVQLSREFKTDNPDRAGAELLRMMEIAKTAQGS